MVDRDRKRNLPVIQATSLGGMKKFGQKSGSGMIKTGYGQAYSSDSMSGPGPSSGDFGNIPPQIRNPLLNVINFYLPQDRKVLNQWLRYYDRFDAIVGNALDMHSEVIGCDFTLSSCEPEAMKVYNEVKDKLGLATKCQEIIREHFLLGEAFPYLQWSDKEGTFTNLAVINPDFVHMKSVPFAPSEEAIRFQLEPSQTMLSS